MGGMNALYLNECSCPCAESIICFFNILIYIKKIPFSFKAALAATAASLFPLGRISFLREDLRLQTIAHMESWAGGCVLLETALRSWLPSVDRPLHTQTSLEYYFIHKMKTLLFRHIALTNLYRTL
jgi:hypothetical protein